MIPSTAASAGGGGKKGRPPGISVVSTIFSFALTDTSGVGSDGFFRRGVAFPPGDVPSGDILAASIDGTPIRVSEMQRNTWSDGSLRSCIIVGNAGSFTADQSKVVSITSAPGSLGTSSISGGAVAFLTGLSDDCMVEIRNHTGSTTATEFDDSEFSLQTALGTSSRVEIQEDTDVCVRAFCWQPCSETPHLCCLHYVDIWLDEDGETPLAYEWTPVLSQHWWVDDPFSVQVTKEEYNYDAECFNGATSLLDVDGLHHAYYCQWAGLRADDDAEHARRFWIDLGSTAMPTLLCEYSTASRVKMMKAGYLPPLDLGVTYSSDRYSDPESTSTGGIADTYTPLGRNGHKRAINAVGGYIGRGVITDADGKAIVIQSSERWRQARVMAQASLSVYHHIKDHRDASGGAFDGDASMGMFPQEIDAIGAQSYTGLAAETIAVSGSGGSLPDDAPNVAINATTATGEFQSWDSAHHTVYGYAMAFLEGERYLADAVLDQHNACNIVGANFSAPFKDPTILFATGGGQHTFRAAALSLPTTPAHGFSHISGGLQERTMGWEQYSWDHAYALLADSNRHKPFLENTMQAASDFFEDSIDEFPASQLVAGSFYALNPPEISSFMNTMALQCLSRSLLLTEAAYPGHVAVADLIARWFRDCAIHNPYTLDLQNHLVATDDRDCTDYVARTERYCSADSRTELDNSGAETIWEFPNKFSPNILPDVGDVCQFSQASGLPLPIGINADQDYFCVEVVSTANSTSATVKLSATEGGAAISTTLPSGTQCRACWKLPGYVQTQLGDNGTTVPSDDDNLVIAWAALEMYYGATSGESEISAADMAQIRTFFAPKSFSELSTWAMDGDNLL